MRMTVAFVAPMVAPFLLFGQTTHAGSANSNAYSVEETIRQLNAEEVRALLVNDANSLRRIWSHEFVVTNPLNEFVAKQEVLALVESHTLAFTSYERHVEYIRVYGNTVVVAGSEVVVWSGKMPLAGKISHLRFTAIWMRDGKEWQEVARHANIIPER